MSIVQSSQQTTAAQNALSGERTFQTVQFATTGDAEADAISGILQVLAECSLGANQSARVLQYLTKRCVEAAKVEELLRNSSQVTFPPQDYSGRATGQLANVHPSINPHQMSQTSPWTNPP